MLAILTKTFYPAMPRIMMLDDIKADETIKRRAMDRESWRNWMPIEPAFKQNTNDNDPYQYYYYSMKLMDN